MKLQFAFGNPRGKKKRKKAKRSVAKRHKRRKNKSVKHSISKKAKVMAKKRRRSKARVKRGRKGKRRNPQVAMIRKNGKVIGREFSPLSENQRKAAEGQFISLMKKFKGAPKMSSERGQLLRAMQGLKTKLGKHSSFVKTLQRYEEDPSVKISKFDLADKKEKSVAKKKRKKKKSSRKVRRHKKAKKSAAPKKHRRKRSKKSRKGSKRRRKHSKKVTAVKAAPKRRRKKSRKGGKKRRRARMISHRHGSNIRHIKKGTSFRFKSKSKRGKRSVTVSGRVRVNPYRRNPSMEDQVKTYSGMEVAELGALALGAALVPIINSGISKVPGGAGIVTAINGVVGAQAVGSVIPIGIGIALNAVAEHVVKSGQGNKALKMAGEGLVAAGLIGLIMGMSQKYVNPMLGLSGINYTPNMRGINFTPNMGIMPQLNGGFGIMPQLNGMGAPGDYGGNAGYHQSSADFGRMGDVRNSGDFGADSSQDSEYDMASTDDGDAHTTAMN